MAQQKFPVTIPDFAGHKVFFFVVELDGTTVIDVNRHIGDGARQRNAYDPDLAQYVILRKGIEGLKIDDKTHSFTVEKKHPPHIRNEEGKPLVFELLGHILKYNDWIIEDYPEAFEEWVLDGEEVPASNPTRFQAVGE